MRGAMKQARTQSKAAVAEEKRKKAYLHEMRVRRRRRRRFRLLFVLAITVPEALRAGQARGGRGERRGERRPRAVRRAGYDRTPR